MIHSPGVMRRVGCDVIVSVAGPADDYVGTIKRIWIDPHWDGDDLSTQLKAEIYCPVRGLEVRDFAHEVYAYFSQEDDTTDSDAECEYDDEDDEDDGEF